MSYLLPHLHSGYAVDQAILGEEDRVVVIRFGHDWDPQCMQVCGWKGGWVSGWVLGMTMPAWQHNRVFRSISSSSGNRTIGTPSVCSWVGGRVGGWVGGWVSGCGVGCKL